MNLAFKTPNFKKKVQIKRKTSTCDGCTTLFYIKLPKRTPIVQIPKIVEQDATFSSMSVGVHSF